MPSEKRPSNQSNTPTKRQRVQTVSGHNTRFSAVNNDIPMSQSSQDLQLQVTSAASNTVSSTAVDPLDTQRPLRILALDGGGVRGLSEVLILKYLMSRLLHEERKKTKQRLTDLPSPWKYFDLICGTSTGGLLALMLGRLRLVIPSGFVC